MQTRRKWAALILLLLLINFTPSQAQPAPPTDDGALIVRFPLPTTMSPLNSGMPYDVMVGYIVGDSIARNLNMAGKASLLRFLTYSDTLKYAMKYIYQMSDYDPVQFFLWALYIPGLMPGAYPSGGPRVLYHELTGAAKQLYPDKKRTAMLVSSDIIAHIKVHTTRTTLDTTAKSAPTAVLVTSSIIEPLKGRRIPNCWIDSRMKRDDSRTPSGVLAAPQGDQAAMPGSCLQFEYRLEWRRLNHTKIKFSTDSTLVDGNGRQWVQPNTEYIVFLSFLALGRDANYSYATLVPIPWFGTVCTMYPIVDGKVYDPYNDFGFGTHLTPDQFKSALRNEINTIINP